MLTQSLMKTKYFSLLENIEKIILKYNPSLVATNNVALTVNNSFKLEFKLNYLRLSHTQLQNKYLKLKKELTKIFQKHNIYHWEFISPRSHETYQKHHHFFLKVLVTLNKEDNLC